MFFERQSAHGATIADDTDDASGASENDEIVDEEERKANDGGDNDDDSAAVGVTGQWVLECTFEHKAMLDEFLKKENWWSYRGCTNTIQGEKVLYRCNRVRRTSKAQCAAGIYVIEKVSYVTVRDADTEATTTKSLFTLYRKRAEHTHDQLPDLVAPKVKDYVEKLIIQQYKDGRKTKIFFYNILDNKDIPMVETPTHTQVVSVINGFKRANYGEAPITMRQLTTFVEKHSDLLRNVDEPIIGFEVREWCRTAGW